MSLFLFQLHRLCGEGHGLQFNSRISPSPSRTTRRRKSRRHSDEEEADNTTILESTRNVSIDDTPASRLLRSSTNSPQSVAAAVANRGGAAGDEALINGSYSAGTVFERHSLRRRLTTVDSNGVLSASEMSATSTTTRRRSPRLSASSAGPPATPRVPPLTPHAEEAAMSEASSKGSPRLQAFDGKSWIRAPRTGYTYVESPMYRDNWTPDRDDVPMPHMARLPLEAYSAGGGGRRRLFEDYSDEEGEPTIARANALYRQSRASSRSGGITSLPATIWWFILQFLSKLVRMLLYDFPAMVSRLDTHLLARDHHQSQASATSQRLWAVWEEIVHIKRRVYIFISTYSVRAKDTSAAVIASLGDRLRLRRRSDDNSEEIVHIRRKVFIFVSTYLTWPVTKVAENVRKALNQLASKDDTVPHDEDSEVEEDLVEESSVPKTASSAPVVLPFWSRLTSWVSSGQTSKPRRRRRRPRKEPTFYDYLPASWRDHDEEGAVPVAALILLVLLPIAVVVISVATGYASQLVGVAAWLLQSISSLALWPLKTLFNGTTEAVSKVAPAVGWSLGKIAELPLAILALVRTVLGLGWNVLSQTATYLMSGAAAALSAVAGLFLLLASFVQSALGSMISAASSVLAAAARLPTWAKGLLLWLADLIIPLPIQFAYYSSKWVMDGGWKLICIPPLLLLTAYLSRKALRAFQAAKERSDSKGQVAKHRSRKKATPFDYIPATWRSHDEDGIPLWAWLVLLAIPLALIFGMLLPAYASLVVAYGASSLKSLASFLYGVALIPVDLIAVGGSQSAELADVALNATSRVIEESAEVTVGLLGALLKYSTKLLLLPWQGALAAGGLLVTVAGKSFNVLEAAAMFIGNAVASPFKYAALAAVQMVAATWAGAKEIIASSLAAPGKLGTLVSSAISAADWKVFLFAIPLFAVFAIASIWDKVKPALVAAAEKVAAILMSKEDEDDFGDEAMEEEEVTEPPIALAAAPATLKARRPSSSAVRKHRSRKAHTWRDYLPAAWRDHDEEGIPLLFWLALALIPLLLVFAALLPEYTIQALNWVQSGVSSVGGFFAAVLQSLSQEVSQTAETASNATAAALDSALDGAEAATDATKTAFGSLLDGLGAGFAAVFSLALQAAELSWQLAVGLVVGAFGLVKDLTLGLLSVPVFLTGGVWQLGVSVSSALIAALKGVGDLCVSLGNNAAQWVDSLWKAAGEMALYLWSGLAAVFDGAVGMAGGLLAGIASVPVAIAGFLGQMFTGASSLLASAARGIWAILHDFTGIALNGFANLGLVIWQFLVSAVLSVKDVMVSVASIPATAALFVWSFASNSASYLVSAIATYWIYLLPFMLAVPIAILCQKYGASLVDQIRTLATAEKSAAKKSLRRRRKAPTWFDYLPASWRGPDEEGIALWLWAVLALIPATLISLALVPGYASAAAVWCGRGLWHLWMASYRLLMLPVRVLFAAVSEVGTASEAALNATTMGLHSAAEAGGQMLTAVSGIPASAFALLADSVSVAFQALSGGAGTIFSAILASLLAFLVFLGDLGTACISGVKDFAVGIAGAAAEFPGLMFSVLVSAATTVTSPLVWVSAALVAAAAGLGQWIVGGGWIILLPLILVPLMAVFLAAHWPKAKAKFEEMAAAAARKEETVVEHFDNDHVEFYDDDDDVEPPVAVKDVASERMLLARNGPKAAAAPKRRKSRKAHTWYDFLPAAWRNHDDEGAVPLWAWILLFAIPLALIAAAIVPDATASAASSAYELISTVAHSLANASSHLFEAISSFASASWNGLVGFSQGALESVGDIFVQVLLFPVDLINSVAGHAYSLGTAAAHGGLNLVTNCGQAMYEFASWAGTSLYNGLARVLYLPIEAGEYAAQVGRDSLHQGIEIANATLESVADAGSAVGDAGGALLQEGQEAFSKGYDAGGALLQEGQEALSKGYEATADAVDESVGLLASLAEAVRASFRSAIGASMALAQVPLDLIQHLVNAAAEGVSYALSSISAFPTFVSAAVSSIGSSFFAALESAGLALQGGFGSLIEVGSQVFEWLWELCSIAVSSLGQVVLGAWELLWSFMLGIGGLFSSTQSPSDHVTSQPHVAKEPAHHQAPVVIDEQELMDRLLNSQRFQDLVFQLTQREAEKLRADVERKWAAFKADLLAKDSSAATKAIVDKISASLDEKVNAGLEAHDKELSDLRHRLDDFERRMREESTSPLESRIEQLERLMAELSKKDCCGDIAALVRSEIDALWTHNATILRDWIKANFVSKDELARMDAATPRKEALSAAVIEARLTAEALVQRIMANVTKAAKEKSPGSDDLGLPDKDEILSLIRTALIRYDADKTGVFDYALETAGGSVVSTRCTEPFYARNAAWSLFGIPLWRPTNNPRTAIQPGVMPGECWAFKGSRGYLVVGLSVPVVPTRFSVEHIPRSMSPSGEIDSAPREFVVLGLRRELDPEPVELGRYAYDKDGHPLQTFDVQADVGDEKYSMVELDILSNHGNMEYTCLYRFRVHGRNN